jgi:hypothetical protein
MSGAMAKRHTNINVVIKEGFCKAYIQQRKKDKSTSCYYIAKRPDCADKKMARDKYPRPCLPLKPQEKKLLYIFIYRSNPNDFTIKQINQKRIGQENGGLQ